jgi:hypothetical protein
LLLPEEGPARREPLAAPPTLHGTIVELVDCASDLKQEKDDLYHLFERVGHSVLSLLEKHNTAET